MKFIYKCKAGVELRQLISKAGSWEMSVEILKCMKKCYKEILDNYPWDSEYKRAEVASAASSLEGDDMLIVHWIEGKKEIRDYGFNHDLQLVDVRLSEFYAICDELQIKI